MKSRQIYVDNVNNQNKNDAKNTAIIIRFYYFIIQIMKTDDI